MNKKLSILVILLPIIAFLAFSSLFIVDQRQYALVMQFGKPIDVKDTPGLKVKLPFVQNIIYFDKRVQDLFNDTSEVYAKDSKQVKVDAYAKYIIKNPLDFYRTAFNETGFKKRLSTILNSNLRQSIGEVNFIELLSEKRSTIMHQIKENVNKEVKSFGVEVIDVRISRADLPDKSRLAVFDRMKSDRNKEAKEIRATGAETAEIIRATADKERTLIFAEARKKGDFLRGEGDAQATKIYAKTFGKDPEFFQFYRSLDAYKESITEDDSMVVTSNHDFLKYFKNH